MIEIYNSINGIHTEIRDNKNTNFSFEINKMKWVRGSSNIQATFNINWFSHNIGCFTSMKKARDGIVNYYNENYDMLLQLKELADLRSELSNKIRSNIYNQDQVFEVLDTFIIEERFNLVGKDRLRITRHELFNTFKKSQEIA